MRIISGIKKGKKILLPDTSVTRPLKDSVKENIFNILKHSYNFRINLEHTNIIDFFSGSGSFGLECLSRKAQKVIFVENNSKTQNTLYRNLSNNFCKYNYEILKKDFFEIDKKKLINQINPDLIFLDPPYEILKFQDIFKFINSLNELKKIIIILHVNQSKTLLFEKFKFYSERVYGKSKIIFLKN